MKYSDSDSELALQIYNAKKNRNLSYSMLSMEFSVTPGTAYDLYNLAKEIINKGDMTWLDGLSSRAKNQLTNAGYRDKRSLLYDIRTGALILEDLPHIGKKVAQEIRRWCEP